MADQPLFHVILATADGHVHELDLRALGAEDAVQVAADEVRMQSETSVLVTNVHARRINGT